MPKFEVELLYHGSTTYFIEATDERSAKRKAEMLFKNGVEGERTGSDWEEISGFGLVGEISIEGLEALENLADSESEDEPEYHHLRAEAARQRKLLEEGEPRR